MFRIAKKLQMLKNKLKVWNNNIFGNLQEMVGTNSMIDEVELMLKTKVHNALAIQEKFWASKSRVRWLQLGYRNTKYFHSMAKIRKSKNFIPKGCSMKNDLFNLIPNMIDLADNILLKAIPSPLEINYIVFRMDAFNIVKYDVCQAFRPIYMGNFIFKIIPKILANMLRVIAPKLIVEEQGAFLKGKQISSNIYMASELPNSFPKKTCDSLEWPFLLEVLKIVGFTAKFVERGLEQGDPLAPLLKMICTLKGPREASDLKIIFFKSELFCGLIPQSRQYAIKRLLGASIGCLPFKYLGVPIFLGAPKARLLRPLLERIRNKLSGALGLRRLRDVNFSILMKLLECFKQEGNLDTSVRSTSQVSSVRPGLLKDVWVKNTSLASQSGLPLSAFKNSKARISHFISGNPQTWCFPIVNSTLLNEFLRAASGIDLRHALIPDQRIWKHTISGEFSTISGIHPRVSLMSWKVTNNAIVIDEKIKSIGIPLVSYCSICGNNMETRDHLFVTCSFGNKQNGEHWLPYDFISGVGYILKFFLISTRHAVDDNIGNFVLHYSIPM
ncbi:hypothetical protein AMTRI_Chr04g183310 [Amborella trichopoda]